MDNFIEVYDDAVDLLACKQIINIFEKLNDRSFVQKTPKDSHRQDDYVINLTHHYDLRTWDKVGVLCFDDMKRCVEDYIEKYSILKNTNFLMFDIKIKKINIGGGFHDWHYETTRIESSNRVLNIQIFLNDVDEGGETEFLYLGKRVPAKAGRLVIYPSFFTHTHRGNPPISNEKYILNSWLIIQE